MINPLVLILGTISFLFAFIVHILIWRMARPSKEWIWLILIFIILPILVYLTLFYFSYLYIDYRQRFIAHPLNILFIILWHSLLSIAYIMSYPAIQAECPSLKIILAISASGSSGLTSESIADLFPEDMLLSIPFDDLVNSGLIFLKNDKWVVSVRGRLLSSFFSAYRHSLGLPLGEG